jgi:hypothetical protein
MDTARYETKTDPTPQRAKMKEKTTDSNKNIREMKSKKSRDNNKNKK